MLTRPKAQGVAGHMGVLDLNGRSVAIVGNAQSLIGAGYGAEIDAHEIVVRMNRGVPEDPASQGARTDLLVFAKLAGVTNVWRKFNARAYMWMSPKGREDAELAIPPEMAPWLSYYDLERWQRLQARLGARPSVGAMTIDHLDGQDARSVTIFGFDFKRTKSVDEVVSHIGPHDYTQEQAYCLDRAAARGWTFRAS